MVLVNPSTESQSLKALDWFSQVKDIDNVSNFGIFKLLQNILRIDSGDFREISLILIFL